MLTFCEYLLNEMYIALVLNDQTRKALKDAFPPKYKDFIGHHVTLKFGVSPDSTLPKHPQTVEVVGYADDGEGLEALVVSVNGKTQRSDGRIFHITWSLDRSKGYKPVDSNKVVSQGYTKLDHNIPVKQKMELLK